MKAYCITIGPDWPLAQAEFTALGMEVECFQAIVEDNRPLAFNKSVYGALSLMPDGGWLFEDDVVFTDGRDTIKEAIIQLPSSALTLHLGCNIIGVTGTEWQMPDRYSDRLAKLHNCWQSHATWYSPEAVKFILDNFKYVTDEYKTEGCQIFDEWLRLNLFPMGRSFLLNPMIAYQRPRKSEIWNVEADYTGAHKQGNEWLKRNL